MNNLYPQKPICPTEGITNPGVQFKKEIIRVFMLCVIFLLLYFLLLSATVGLALLVGYLGFLLVSAVSTFITLMLFIGAIGMGVMLVFFMLKALVFRKATPIATVGEVTPDSEPLLFDFIERICLETRTFSPKRIYLIDDVNAFVSYDSVFLSLFLPARKNLYIGLGLINSLTVSELKAVVAHEFGHFSQGSMRFGSYIYHFNQIIYKMVADDSSYLASLEKWAGLSNYFALFVNINMYLIQGVQRLMGYFYQVLNKGYMRLARQMEFHADAVAATVAGSAPLISGLYRMDLAVASYDQLLVYYNALINENIKATNLYVHHFKLMQLLATRGEVQLKNGFPIINAQTIDRLGRSRIVIKDQWASHPSVEDRETALLKLNISSETTIDEPAWNLFADASMIQTANTERLYEGVVFSSDPTLLDGKNFETRYMDYFLSKSFQPEYKGYYDNRYITPFDIQLHNYIPEDLSLVDLLEAEFLNLPKQVSMLEEDIVLLNSIITEKSDYQSFDCDGVRYSIVDAHTVKAYLSNELDQIQNRMKQHDQEIYYIARRNALNSGRVAELEQAFIWMFKSADFCEKDTLLYREFLQEVSPVYTQLPLDEIETLVMKIIHKEKELKRRLGEMLEDRHIHEEKSFMNDIEIIRQFKDSNHVYFTDGKYLEDELELLNHACNSFITISVEYCFQVKKNALALQKEFLWLNEVEIK